MNEIVDFAVDDDVVKDWHTPLIKVRVLGSFVFLVDEFVVGGVAKNFIKIKSVFNLF